jgi:hypothetical protein
VVGVEVVVVVVVVPVVLVSSLVAFPAAPCASPDVLVTFAPAFLSWCFPFAAVAASERQHGIYSSRWRVWWRIHL